MADGCGTSFPQLVHAQFDAADTSKDGWLDFNEFAALYNRLIDAMLKHPKANAYVPPGAAFINPTPIAPPTPAPAPAPAPPAAAPAPAAPAYPPTAAPAYPPAATTTAYPLGAVCPPVCPSRSSQDEPFASSVCFFGFTSLIAVDGINGMGVKSSLVRRRWQR
jgi:hypothetical protein